MNKKFQDYSNCHESITEKLVVIDVSDVIGEAIRYLVLLCICNQVFGIIMYLQSGIWYSYVFAIGYLILLCICNQVFAIIIS